jgi:cyclopropane fatty-acyl-phospholipid synthase-like methyltransferase
MNEMDEIYRKTPPGEIPWNMETPPQALVDLHETKKVVPCKTIDLGCGAGNYAIYFAGLGYKVTGIDISDAAIRLAQQNAAKKKVDCGFLVADMLGDMHEVAGTFGFAYDWEVLHHIFPENRRHYIENVSKMLDPGGKYLSVCFSVQDTQFGGSGKYRKTRLNTELYFSDEDELRILFDPFFKIKELKTIEVSGKTAPHMVNYAFLERK